MYATRIVWSILVVLCGLALRPASAQDPAPGGSAVGAEAGAYLGSSFSNLPLYRDGHGAMVGGLAGSVLGALALAPVGGGQQDPANTPPAARPPVALRVECHTFTDAITVDGKAQPITGLACKQPDGSWKVVP